MRIMDLRLVEVFRLVCEESSFSGAGRRLGLSQPTISGHVKSLEDSLGTRLFDRSGRKVRLTRAGEVLYEAVHPLAELRRTAEEKMGRFLNRLEGHLVLGASTIPGEYLLPHRITTFRGAHPGIRVRLIIRDSKAILEDLLDRRIELGFVGGRLFDAGLSFSPFGEDRVALIAAPALGLPKGRSLDLESLKRCPLLVREPGSGTRHVFQQALARRGRRLEELNVVAELGSTAALKEAALGGLGVAVVSELAVTRELDTGRIRRIAIRGLDPLTRTFFMVQAPGRSVSPLCEAFLESLK